jgi:hypothetical protein
MMSSKLNLSNDNYTGSLLRAGTPSIFTRHDLSAADGNTISNRVFREYHIVKDELNDTQKKVMI